MEIEYTQGMVETCPIINKTKDKEMDFLIQFIKVGNLQRTNKIPNLFIVISRVKFFYYFLVRLKPYQVRDTHDHVPPLY